VNEQFAAYSERRKAGILCIVAVVAMLVATMWPCDPFPRNGVTWLQRTGGLRFEKPGLVISNESLRPTETQAAESYSLELLIRPASTKSTHPILGFYAPTRAKQLMVRQYQEGLVVTHDAAAWSDTTQTITFYMGHIFRPGRLVLLTISSGPRGTAVYLDGQPAGSFPRFRISRSELSGQIVLGTSPVAYDPWTGELRGLAIYSKNLTPVDALKHYEEWTDPSGSPDLDGAMARYGFAERQGRELRNDALYGPPLEIPATFSVPHKVLLRSPADEFTPDWNYAADILMNIAGFVPLGLIVCGYLAWTRSRWNAVLITTIICGMLSFVIEVLQYYIPRRGSGTTDIIMNTLGAALGAALAQVDVVRRSLKRMTLMRIRMSE